MYGRGVGSLAPPATDRARSRRKAPRPACPQRIGAAPRAPEPQSFPGPWAPLATQRRRCSRSTRRPPTPSKLFPPQPRAHRQRTEYKIKNKNNKNVWLISKRHPRIRMYEWVVRNLRNAIPRRLPRLFERADAPRARGAARARAAPVRVRPRERPHQSASKRSCPLGELRRWEVGKFAMRVFSRSGAPCCGARARARARGFAGRARRNAANRDFATRPERLRVVCWPHPRALHAI